MRKYDKESFNKIKWIKVLLTISLLGKIIISKLIVIMPPTVMKIYVQCLSCFIDFSLSYFWTQSPHGSKTLKFLKLSFGIKNRSSFISLETWFCYNYYSWTSSVVSLSAIKFKFYENYLAVRWKLDCFVVSCSDRQLKLIIDAWIMVVSLIFLRELKMM